MNSPSLLVPLARPLLENLLDASREGLRRGAAPVPDLLGSLEAESRRTAAARLPAADLERLRRSAAPRERALQAARAGDALGAVRSIREARVVLQEAGMERECQLLAGSLQTAAEAYLDYRNGELAKARRAMRASLAAATALQDECGYEFMEARRLHLARNLLRLDARAGDLEGAVGAGSGLLSYLEGDAAAWPHPDMRLGNAPPLPDVVARVAAGQIAEEVALAVAAAPPASHPALLTLAGAHLHAGRKGACSRFPTVHAWLRLKARWAAGDFPGFVRAAPALLREGRGETPVLWLTAASDAVALCDSHGVSDAHATPRRVAEEVAAHPHLAAVSSSDASVRSP